MKVTHMLAALIAVALLALMTLALVSHRGESQLLAAMQAQVNSADALRNHMQADMMHDALRGDVLAARLARRDADTAGIDEARASYSEHAAEFRGALKATLSKAPSPQLRQSLQDTAPALDRYIATAGEVIDRSASNTSSPDADAEFSRSFEQLETRMADLSQQILDLNEHNRADAQARGQRIFTQQVVAVLVAATMMLLIGGLIVGAIARQLGGEPRAVMAIAQGIADGRLDQVINVPRGRDASLVASMARMQRDLRERTEAERKVARENLRIRTALDNASTGLYIADPDLNVIYANNALQALLDLHAGNIAAHAPAFHPGSPLVGRPASVLAADNRIDAELLQQLDQHGSAHREINFGATSIAQDVSAIRDQDGQRAGFVCEWRDRTQETEIEAEVTRVVGLAAAGDMSARIVMERKQGFFLQLAEQLNRLLEANAQSTDEVSALLSALAQGDLTRRMHGDFHGVFARMRDNANATASYLTDIVGRLQDAAGNINTAASEIASGNSDLAQRTEQQAASLEKTAASMEELTSTVKQNAEHARQANQLAQGAAGVARDGGEVVGQVVTTMTAIEASSKKIADIISVIDGIAFQTNILALNAAVEAARAGEQGRGFAVVASEVRTLAQRSANAAKEIKGLIDDSVERVADGSALVHKAGSTMREIVASVQRVTDIMAEISAASQEQSSGIEQVNQTITRMDETTQQNAALVEEATAAARSMEEQARQLATTVTQFRTSRTSDAPRQPPASPPATASKIAAVTRAPPRPPRNGQAIASNEGGWAEF